ncbi:17413_t:CDS:10 [Racocetra persica]|uniref:17413_t:CDS:1 n=1 Tax=Racocetra persica TaxID=160502 RepID=A0ACA9K7S6_9GLOM|nr:17413_t:CDS:10 [Racocetra persica]
MDRLKILLPLSDTSDLHITSTTLTLLRSSQFWNFILRATGKVSDLNAHPYIRQIKAIISGFIKIIKKDAITIRSLQQLLKYEDETLIRFFNSNNIKQGDINKLRIQCGNYEEKLAQLHYFYTQFCPVEKIKGVDVFLKDMEQRSKCDTLTLQETLADNHWEYHKTNENAAKLTYKLANLQTFRNIFNQKINSEEEINIEELAQSIIPSLAQIYEQKTMKYKTNEWETLYCIEESTFWNNVKDVKAELDFMNLKADKRLIKTLTYVSRYPIYVERLQQLNEVVSMFKVTHTKEDWIETQLTLLNGNYLWLGRLNDFFEYHDRSLSSLNENCWELIKSLSLADEFIRFLQSVAEHDITNIINGVDNQSDERLIQEDTVSSLIQVKKFLLPLLKNVESLKPKTFLKKLCEITEQNPVLGQKITLCNSNRKALENMYKNINNRTEVTQERIINAVKIGTYTFKRISNDDKCTATLSYPINSFSANSDSMDDKDESNEKPYTLNDLQDLRGRALLIAKPGVTIEMEIPEKEQEQQERAKKIMNEFVIQVDFAQEIINVASKLIQIGHFNYRDFNKSVKGTENMQKLLNELNEHLVEWAQKEHYYLTFFPARHILAFHDYFNDNAKDKAANLEECQILITFVNNAARLPPPKSQIQMEIIDDIHENSHDYYSTLCSIGSKLADIFENIPKQIREIKDTGERIKSDIVQPGKLFVAACSNKSLVPNIIMSLYANHKSYPQPWQILICTSSTTMEELSIFTKRCFFASDNGYDGHLFCIANLELVDFELQYNLVNNIRSMNRMKNIKDKYLLALICCKESEVQHHILDQFSQDIHVTNGLDVDAMKGIYQELCPDVRRVSSELSGQGKTEWIKDASFEKNKIPRSFLISDGVDFGTLVRRLKEHKIRPVESLHLNIVSADNPGDVNLFLFELLTLGMVSNYTDIVCLPNTPIFIEVATTVGQYLLKSLPFVECLSSEHITWDISNLSVSQEIDNPIQIVCHYLEADEKSTIEEKDLLFNTTGTDITEPLEENRCRELIKKYLFDDKDDSDISSYRFVEIFINVLANQLIGLSLSSYFRVDNLKLMTKEKDIRKTLVNTLLTASKDFATRSIKTKAAQLESITPLNDDRLGTIVQWEDSNHLLVFFLSQAPDSICALYRNAKKVPDNVTKLLQTGVVEVKFHALNLHAGISEDIIRSFMTMVQDESQEKETWIFFDEINTCNYMGLLSDLIAHRRWLGKEVHYNIRIFAACNPYRKRTKSQSSVGLKVQQKIKYEERNELVYQVKPLPDQILDYVWDYGILQALEEEKYIQTMVSESLGEYDDNSVFAKLLAESQRYIRHIEEPYSVSLRDVKRAITLVKFFAKSLTNRPPIRRKNSPPYPNPADGIKFSIRCYVLSLGLCYQCRMYEQSIRQTYREKMARLLLTNGIQFDEAKFNTIIRQEQEDYINRMICPPNTAHNEALLENVLVMIVCILTKIPVFIIGAPGSSKSLAIRLVSQNLKGSDSNDKYFQELPQVYLIPYQGSSSSTSDGIIKVFEKAVNYQNTSSKEFKIISVVLLDEVGLAETSPFNPLKVLHSLLEPSYPSDGPTVAFIGISNWRLDNSKSSRALLVQRPKFDLDDLIDTAVNLLGSKTNPGGSKITSSSLKPLADAYSSYEQTGQLLPNFHGLRDYYALVKSLSLAELTPQNIQKSLVRNFGGTDPEQTQKLCEHYFGEVFRLSNDAKNWEYTPIPVEELINANLDDEGARHLMVIGKSDSIVSLLTYQLRSRNLDPVIILGSQFPDDRDDYSYSVLSRIMMCVEAGRPLILTDLEIIYGSLYDLWNQNYIVVGSADDPKYYTRVALGAYANPMLFVNKTFRCILVLDEKKLETADPPLLNRFEKQKMTINNILTPQNIQIVEQLSSWVTQMSKVFGGLNSAMSIMEFKQKDLFIGFDPDETLQSLVIDITKRYPNSDDADILQKCKEKLIAIASSDGIIRAEKSGLDADEIKFWKNIYYNDQCHNDLATYIQSSLNKLKNENYSEGLQVIINTFSNINTDVEACLKDTINCQVDKLSTFKTEAQLQNRVKHFWLNSTAEMLILQCDVTTISAGCIKLAKFIIEQFKNDYMIKKKTRPELKMKTKHSCVILHIHRKQENSLATFNFMCGWDQITIETLSEQEIPLSKLLDRSLNDVINTTYKFEDILKQELLWCLLCMKYPSNIKSIEHIRILNSEICKHPILLECIKARTQQWLQEKASKSWQYDVASNKKLLYRYPSFLAALQAYIKGFVRRPIAKALCALERFAATKTFFLIDNPNISNEDNYLLNFWLEMFNDQKIINIEEISEPSPDLYTMPLGIYNLQFPFSYYFMEQIDNFRPIYQEEINILYQNPDNVNNLSGELEDSVINEYLKNFTEKIRAEVPLLKTSPLDKASDLYFKDFISVIACNEPGNKDPELLESIFERRLGKEKVLNPIILHTYWWIHGNSIMAELQLVQICPTIAPELKNKSGDAVTLVKEAIEILLVKISKDKNMNEAYEQKEVDRWKYEATKVLSFSKEIPKASTLESLKLLQFCNDLLSIKSIRPHSISRIISLAQNSVSTLTIEVLNVLFDVLYEIEPTEINLVFKRNIILRCLDIIPLESDLRIWLYRRLFENQPFPLMGIIIQKIFETEKTAHEGIFFQLIKGQPGILTFYPRLQEIDKYLTELDLKMATLCCDIIQRCFFAKTTIEKLVSYFPHALRTLCEEEIQPLQRISAVAFLKEFVRMFFDVVINNENASVAYQLDSIQGINGTNFLHKIIEALKVEHSLVYSLRIYFLRDLRRRGYSFDEVRRFCKRRPDELPWLNNFPWESSDSTRFPFNPYWHLSEYPETEIAYANMRRIGNKVQIDDFLKKVDGGSINSRLSLIGLLVMRLHAVRASRGWDEKERELTIHLKSKIDNMISLPDAYRQMVSKLLENTHNLYKIGTDTTSNNLIMKSVLIYIVGLHASMNSDFSPLTAYLQEIEGCGSMFILSCQSDEESALFNAVAAMGGVSRYQCQCGFKYVIGNCGGAMVTATCPGCGNTIGGSHHRSAPGNTRLDQDIVLSVTSNDQAGYVSEKLESSQTYTVRAMCPTSYRILHLIVHTLILASTPSEATNNFFKQNGNTYGDVTDYCMKHIENDWAVLKKLLNISDENLALLFHSILIEMINNPNHSKPNHLFNSVARQQWETNFARNYVTPLINNVTQTIRNFSTSLRNAMNAAEVSSNILDTEISQTLDMSPQHCKEYLPGLWRTLGTVCYESLNAYYSRDMHHNVQAFPFLAVYFKHEKSLSQIKHLYPIVNFVKILHSNLAYRLQREKAVSYTFKEFIDESKNEAMFDTRMTLNTAFEEFANAWNSVIDNVTRYQCHELPRHPQITINDSVTFGLMEARDSGVFLCAIIDYLVDLHNNFLEDVIAIPERSCLSLKFLEEATPWVYEEIVTSTQVRVTKATNPYHIPSKRLDSIKRSNIVDYEWDNRILRYSQHNLKIGHGEDIMFDLQAIEMELAQTLVSEKAYIERNGDQLLMDKFPYHLELFQSSMRILGEIKELIPQEPIPNDKISLIFESTSSAPLTSNPFKNANILAKYSIENATELLSFLEIFLCFIKRISADNGETLMKEFVNQWLKLSNLMENIGFQHILNLELKLKHAISLYELVENQVANEEIKYLNTKYKKSLDEDMKNQVLEAIDFEQNTGEQKQKIPAEAFVIALKRYMQRFLCTDNIKASDPLYIYVNDMSLNLWPDSVPEELLDDVFPDSLLVENTFEAYEFVNNMIKVDQQSLPAVKQINPIELDNSMEVDHPGVDRHSMDLDP